MKRCVFVWTEELFCLPGRPSKQCANKDLKPPTSISKKKLFSTGLKKEKKNDFSEKENSFKVHLVKKRKSLIPCVSFPGLNVGKKNIFMRMLNVVQKNTHISSPFFLMKYGTISWLHNVSASDRRNYGLALSLLSPGTIPCAHNILGGSKVVFPRNSND